MSDLNRLADLLLPGIRNAQLKLEEVFNYLSAMPNSLRHYDGWKPIETAPMDTDVLLFEPDYSIFVGSNFSLDDGDSYWCACGGPRRKPTHWMPLPEPPK